MSNRSSTSTGYAVEARNNYSEPAQVGDQVFTKEWKQVHFAKGAGGVPNSPLYEVEYVLSGTFSYAAAQALRWWFHANAAASRGMGMCIESRIVKYKIEFSASWEPVTVHDYVHGEDRSSSMPDWGVKEADLKQYDKATI